MYAKTQTVTFSFVKFALNKYDLKKIHLTINKKPYIKLINMHFVAKSKSLNLVIITGAGAWFA
jgi:hypothetical protein